MNLEEKDQMENGEIVIAAESFDRSENGRHDSVVTSCSSLSPTSSSENNFFHSNTDAIDEILADFPENTTAAPRAEMEDDSSDEDPASQGKAASAAVDGSQGAAAAEATTAGIEDSDGDEVDCVQHQVFAVHFNLTATAVDIDSTPTGSENETERDEAMAIGEEESAVRPVDVSLDSLVLSAADGPGTGVDRKGPERSSDGGGGSEDRMMSRAIVLSSSGEATPRANYGLNGSAQSPDETMYVYEVRRSDEDESEEDGREGEKTTTTRVFIRFSGDSVNGHPMEHEEEAEAEEEEEDGSEDISSRDSAEHRTDGEVVFTNTLNGGGGAAISPEDSPLKSANENSTDEKICPPNEMQTEVLAYRSIIESPKFPSSPIDGIIPSVVKSPGSGASNILEQEFRKERTTSDQEQKTRDDEIGSVHVSAEFQSKATMNQSLIDAKRDGEGSQQSDLDRGIDSTTGPTDHEQSKTHQGVTASVSSTVEDDLPPPASFMQTMLKKFRQMEKENARGQPLFPLKAKSAPSTPIRRPLLYDDSERRKVPGGGPSNDGPRPAEMTIAEETTEPVDEFPQKGLAKNLLAQWRMLEAQELRARERAEQRRRPTVTTRSQSLSRIEETQRMLYEGKTTTTTTTKSHGGGGGGPGEDVDSLSESSLITASVEGILGVVGVTVVGSTDGTCDGDHLPPPLMTKYVLAKFRDLEAESTIIAGIQPKPRKNFKWEVKESQPLSRGGLIVHGDLPRGKSSDCQHSDRKRSLSEPGMTNITTSDDDDDDDDDDETHENNDDDDENDDGKGQEEGEGGEDSAGRDDELPPPETTKALLAHFRSIEETCNGVTVETTSRRTEPRSRSQSSSRSAEGQRHGAMEHESGGNARNLDSSVSGSVDRDPGCSCSADELPEQGMTRNLLAKFQLMQSNP